MAESESLEKLFNKMDMGFSAKLKVDPLSEAGIDKVRHLLETDPALYEYMLLKESKDDANFKAMSYEQSSLIRTVMTALKEKDHRDNETMNAMYSIMEKQGKEIKSLKRWKWMFFINLGIMVYLALYWLHKQDPEATNHALEFIKALGKFISII